MKLIFLKKYQEDTHTGNPFFPNVFSVSGFMEMGI